ncbi:hypothetical protein ACFPRL_25290 [Pseudoclavibacter helvolus]
MIWRVSVARPPDACVARPESASDFLPLLASVCATASAKLLAPDASAARSFLREARRMAAAMANVTAAERMTERMTPRWLPCAVMMRIAKIDPGEAGATRPDWKMTFVRTPVAPPPITARIRAGLASTYGK